MSRRVSLHSVEGRRLVERGPAWREHPDYYAPEPEEIPWHTEADVDLGVARMANYAAQSGGLVELTWDLLEEPERRNFARVCLGMKPR